MLNDFKRHLRKKGAKTAMVIAFIGILGYSFLDAKRFSISQLFFSLIFFLFWFLIFSWGSDNPEDTNTLK